MNTANSYHLAVIPVATWFQKIEALRTKTILNIVKAMYQKKVSKIKAIYLRTCE